MPFPLKFQTHAYSPSAGNKKARREGRALHKTKCVSYSGRHQGDENADRSANQEGREGAIIYLANQSQGVVGDVAPQP